jgi:hypothetical protein
MKRQLFWMATVLCVCTGCAAHRPSEAQALAWKINRQPASSMSCGFGEVRYCESDTDLEAHCACVDSHALFRQRQTSGLH